MIRSNRLWLVVAAALSVLPARAAAQSIAIGNGASEPGNVSVFAGQTGALDTFTLTPSAGTPTVTAVTVAFTAGSSAVSAVSINSLFTCGGTQYGSVASPGATAVIGTSFPLSAATTFYVCVTGGTVGSATSVTGTVSSVTAVGYSSIDNDGTSATVTVQPPPAVPLYLVDASTGEGATTLAPGDGEVALDAFTLEPSAGTATPTSLTVTMPAGSAALIETLTVENTSACNQATPHGTVTNPVSDAPSIAVSGLSFAGRTPLWICLKPRTHPNMPAPAGSQVAVTGQVTAVAAMGFFLSGSEGASPARTIDNLSPTPVISGLAGTPGSVQIVVTWTVEPAAADFVTGGEVVVLRKVGSAPTEVPVEGVNYAGGEAIGTATVACVAPPGARSCAANGLTAGTSYYFVAFSRDVRFNSSLGSTAAGPIQPTAFLVEGDTTLGGTRPAVSIINPVDGPVGGTFKVQARVASPGGAAITGVTLRYNTASVAMVRNAKYGSAVDAGVWEYPFASLAPGAYTLRAEASNASGSVLSRRVDVTIHPTHRGDGMLLVRDNASQLCSDCHAGLTTHASGTTTNTYGSWSMGCRDCHTPHSTTNLGLIRPQLRAPELTGAESSRAVVFLNRSGYVTGGMASPEENGVCQVCHTRTKYYRQDGTLATHETGKNCASCHDHKAGLKASCSGCHGTDGRVASVTGADGNLAAAPPALATPAPTGQVAAGNGHLLHLDAANLRTSPIQCADCHATGNHADGHADVGWGTLATSNGFTPTPAVGRVALSGWPATPTCTNWCHGQGLAGGGGPVSFDWTSTAALSCASCHGAPPPVDATAAKDHPQNGTCAACHGTGYATTGLDATAKGTHIDGVVNKPANGCTACHGELAGLAGAAVPNTSPTSAPGYSAGAVDTQGNTARTSVGVGAHIRHVNAGTMMAAKCAECHLLPAAGDTTHADAGLDWGWAGNFGVTASYAAPSCTIWCHSNAQPLGGTVSSPSMSWTSTSSLGCASCHQVAVYGGTGLSAKHQKHLVGYAYTCDECHAPTMANDSSTVIGTLANHVNRAKDVDFSTTLRATAINQAVGAYAGSPGYGCTATYCHSNGTVAVAPFGATTNPTAMSWSTGTTDADCDNCHGGNSSATYVLGTSSHGAHVNNAAVIGTNYGCVTCHSTTVTADRTLAASPVQHVDGEKDVTAPSWNGGTKSCGTNYCHSNGRDAGATDATRYASATWGGAALTCKGCHGRGAAVSAAPDYVDGATLAEANSHSKHTSLLADATSCVKCHAGLVNAAGTAVLGSSHTNSTRDVVIAAAYDTNGGTGADNYNATTKTCSGVSCHGAGAPVWGGSMDCSGCHMGATGTGDAEVDDFTYGNGTFAELDPEDWITNGHGLPSASSYDSGNPGAGFDTAIAVSADDGCKYCHDGSVPHGAFGTSVNPFRLANVGAGTTLAQKNGVCTACHGGAGYLGKTATLAIDATHYGTKHGGANGKGGELCWDCHDPHGDSRYTTNATETPVVAANEPLAYMIDAKLVQTRATSAAGSTTEWGQTATLAANSPRFNKVLGTSNTTWDWGDYVFQTGLNGVCQACHTATIHFKNSIWATTIAAHSDTDPTHNPGKICTTCHGHDQVPTDAFSASCNGCHGSSTPRTPVTANADSMLDYSPPTGALGETATTDRHVGAHQSHVNQVSLRADPLLCSSCHGPSASLPRHPGTGFAYIEWGSLATTGPVTPVWNGTTCSATYCHGNFKNGNYLLASAPVPGAPAGLSFTNVGGKSLTLSWGKVSGAWAYRIERGTGAAPADWAQVATTSATSYDDGGLAPNTTYSYRVTAWVPNGSGTASAAASRLTAAVTTPPSTVTYDLAPQTATSLGADGTTNIVAQASYTWTTTVYRGLGVAAYTRNTTTQGRLYRNGTLTANSRYQGVLYTPALTSNNPVAANLPISIDWVNRTVVASGIGWFEVSLFEYNATTGDVGAAKGTWTSANIPQTTGTTTTFNTLTATLNNPQFYISSGNRLKVVIAYVTGATAPGDLCLLFGATRVASATAGLSRGYTTISPTFGLVAEVIPGAPSGLTITGYGPNEVSLAWIAGANATSYRVERAPESAPGSGTPGTWAQVGKPKTNSITDGALNSNTLYFYRVTAFSTAGSAALATVVSQRTGAPANGIPSWTGTFTPGTTTLTCASCHGNPPGGTHPSTPNCSVCHTNYGNAGAVPQVVDTVRHLNGVLEYDGDCVSCHSYALGARREVVSEFGMTWSHKRSGSRVVTPADCIVCHMEGDPATGKPSGVHMDGVISLRDPDTGTTIQGVNFTAGSGSTPGSFAPSGSALTFTTFSRDLTVRPQADPAWNTLAAIQINLCLHCHDDDGAASTLARVPTTGTAGKPFGTTIAPAQGTYTGASGLTACDGTPNAVADGCVVNVKASFLTSNSSYHPILGDQNNWWARAGVGATAPASDGRMVAPWNKPRVSTTANATEWGYVMTCWDCHALPTDTGTITGTVTAHGGTATLRGTPTVTGTPSTTNQVMLCKKCHLGYDTSAATTVGHGSGSAMTYGRSTMSTYLNWGCAMCHGSGSTAAVPRPIRAEDSHGSNVLRSVGTSATLLAGGRWATNGTPYAFIRNRGALGNHQPLRIGATSYTPQCNQPAGGSDGSICSGQGSVNYTPGGTY